MTGNVAFTNPFMVAQSQSQETAGTIAYVAPGANTLGTVAKNEVPGSETSGTIAANDIPVLKDFNAKNLNNLSNPIAPKGCGGSLDIGSSSASSSIACSASSSGSTGGGGGTASVA